MKRALTGNKNLFTGLLFMAVGAWFGVNSLRLSLGAVDQMGPGFFPFLLSALLVAVGVAVVFSRVDAGSRVDPIPVKAFLFILSGPISFALLADGIGFVPAIWLAVYLPTHASAAMRRRTALILACVFTFGAWLLFKQGLGIPLPVFGKWLAGRG